MSSLDTYAIEFRWPNTIGYFPSQLTNVPIQEQDVIKAHIDIEIKQVCFFEGQPSMGWPHHYAVNGETLINGEKKIVMHMCTDEEFRRFQKDQAGMIFELMGGETIPTEWL